MRSVPTPHLEPAARLVLACLREHPDENTVRSMAEGALASVLEHDGVHAALVELRARGLAREASGRWRLTRMGHELRGEGAGDAGRCRVTRERSGTVVTVTAVGSVRGSGGRALRDELRCADDDDPEIILLDIGGVLEIDGEGIEAIVEADGRGRRGGARLVVMPGPDRVQEAIARAGLAERLTFVAARDIAV